MKDYRERRTCISAERGTRADLRIPRCAWILYTEMAGVRGSLGYILTFRTMTADLDPVNLISAQ